MKYNTNNNSNIISTPKKILYKITSITLDMGIEKITHKRPL